MFHVTMKTLLNHGTDMYPEWIAKPGEKFVVHSCPNRATAMAVVMAQYGRNDSKCKSFVVDAEEGERDDSPDHDVYYYEGGI